MTEETQRRELSLLLHDLSHEGCQKAAMVTEAARMDEATPKTGGWEGLPLAHVGLPISVKARFGLSEGTWPPGKELRKSARQTLLTPGSRNRSPRRFY